MKTLQYFSDAEKVTIEAKNCQNLIGGIVVPLGWAGPVSVNIQEVGAETSNTVEMRLPLATTEGALVPSINRGCKALREAGGAAASVEQRGMSRAPVFQCPDGAAAIRFSSWMSSQKKTFQEAAQVVSKHLQFMDLQCFVEGRLVFVRCTYDPDQAMGMNMVTIATQRAWEMLKEKIAREEQGFEVEMIALSSNLCTDKKPAAINRLLGRGWWVQVEVFLSEEIVERVLKTTSQRICTVHHAKNVIGSHLAGGAPQNMQIANAVAAVLIATGQDAAHVVDISQGSTSFEMTEGGLYVAVTLPTVPVGVVGGGTWLPAQQEALKLIGAGELPSAAQLAAGVGVAALAAEISGMAALAAHHLARAHQTHGRDSHSDSLSVRSA